MSKPQLPTAPCPSPASSAGRQQDHVVVPAQKVTAQPPVEIRDLRAAERRIRSDVAGVRRQVESKNADGSCAGFVTVVAVGFLLFVGQYGLLAVDKALCGGQVAGHLWTEAEHVEPITGNTLVAYVLELFREDDSDKQLSPDALVCFLVGSTIASGFSWKLFYQKLTPGALRPKRRSICGCRCTEVTYSPTLAENHREVRGLLLFVHLLLVVVVWFGWFLAIDGLAGLLCALIAVLYYAVGTLLCFYVPYGVFWLCYGLCFGVLWVFREAGRAPLVLCWRACRQNRNGCQVRSGPEEQC